MELSTTLKNALKVVAPTTAIAALIFFVGYTYERERAEVFGVTPEFFDRSDLDYVLSGVPVALILLVILVAAIVAAAILSGIVRWSASNYAAFTAVLGWLLVIVAFLLVAQSILASETFVPPEWLVTGGLGGGAACIGVWWFLHVRDRAPRKRRGLAVVGAFLVLTGLVFGAHLALNPNPNEFVSSQGEALGSSIPRAGQAHTWLLAVGLVTAAFAVARATWGALRAKDAIAFDETTGDVVWPAENGRPTGAVVPTPPTSDDATPVTRAPTFRQLRAQKNWDGLAIRLLMPFREAKRSTDEVAPNLLAVALVALLAGATAVYTVRLVEVAGSSSGARLIGHSDGNFFENDSDLAEVVVLSGTRLKLDLPGVSPEWIQESQLYQYRGIRLLHRSGDEYLLVGFVPNASGTVEPVVFAVEESEDLLVVVDRGGVIRDDEEPWLRAGGVGFEDDGSADIRFGVQTDATDELPPALKAREQLQGVLFNPAFRVNPVCDANRIAADSGGLRLIFQLDGGPSRPITSAEDLGDAPLVGWRYTGGTDPLLSTPEEATIGGRVTDSLRGNTRYAVVDDGSAAQDDGTDQANAPDQDGTPDREERIHLRTAASGDRIVEMWAGEQCASPTEPAIVDCTLVGDGASYDTDLSPAGPGCDSLALDVTEPGASGASAWDDLEPGVRVSILETLAEYVPDDATCTSPFPGSAWAAIGTAEPDDPDDPDYADLATNWTPDSSPDTIRVHERPRAASADVEVRASDLGEVVGLHVSATRTQLELRDADPDTQGVTSRTLMTCAVDDVGTLTVAWGGE